MTTREQRLRELCDKWRNPKWEATNDDEQGFLECLGYCADELAAILAEPVEVSEDMLDRAHDAYESEARHTANNIALRNALTAALKETGQ